MDVHIERGRRKTTRERERASSKTFFYKDCSVCLIRNSHTSHRERDRQTDKQRDRQSQRDNQRQKETYRRKGASETVRFLILQHVMQIKAMTYTRQRSLKTFFYNDCSVCSIRNSQRERQTDRHREGETDRQTDRRRRRGKQTKWERNLKQNSNSSPQRPQSSIPGDSSRTIPQYPPFHHTHER